MSIHPFDEDLRHRKILPHNPAYDAIYRQVKSRVETHCPDLAVIHIGSTAVADLRGKPMVDLFAIGDAADLRSVQLRLEKLGFHRRDTWTDRDDKPYVCGSVRMDGEVFNVNIHIARPDYANLQAILRFRDLLRERADLRRRYEQAKDQAHTADSADPETYNKAKEPAIAAILAAGDAACPQFGTRDPRVDYILRPGGYALIRRGREIAVVQTPHFTVFPGGGQESDEALEQTAIRETREEIGMDIEIVRPLGTADQILQPVGLAGLRPRTPEQKNYTRKRCHFFAARPLAQSGAGEPDHQLRWLPAAAAQAALSFAADSWAVRQLLSDSTAR